MESFADIFVFKYQVDVIAAVYEGLPHCMNESRSGVEPYLLFLFTSSCFVDLALLDLTRTGRAGLFIY